MADAVKSREHIAAAVKKMQLGDQRGAIADWLRAIELQPDHPQLHSGFEALGSCYANVGELQKSEDAYREAIRRCPSFSQAHAGLGNVLIACDSYTEAMDEYRIAIEQSKDHDLRAMIRIGLQAIEKKTSEQAVRQRAQLLFSSISH